MSGEQVEQPRGRRSTRAKKKVIDYAKVQDFSDEDLFEDVSQREPLAVPATAPKKRKTKGSRKSKGKKKQHQLDNDFNNLDHFENDAEDDYVPSKPVYTEKGYDPALPPIRERFPFMPEYELDGSPRIDLIVGRRPVDEKDDKNEGLKETSSDDDEGGDSNTADDDDEEQKGQRGNAKRNNGVKKSSGKKNSNNKESGQDFVEYEYLVKYKNLSYMHLEWKLGADLESMNKSAKTMYRRYVKKVALNLDEELESPEFDPSFVVVQKVLAEEEQELELEVEGEELLKWEKQREKELAEEDLSEEERELDEERKKEEEISQQEQEAKKVEEKVVKSADVKDGEAEGQKYSPTIDDEKKELILEEKKG